MSDLTSQILALANLRSPHIANRLGCSARYVRRVLSRHGLAHDHGPPRGQCNPSWRGGRMVDSDGYVCLKTKPTRVLEHRVVMQRELGRLLLPQEVVDHIDGITIHNDPANLRLFSSNADHLAATTRKPRQWSASGLENIGARTDLGVEIQPVDIHHRRKERGDVRLRAILRAALELGTTHPCLCGTTHWLEQKGIDPASRHSLELAWIDLENRYAQDLRL